MSLKDKLKILVVDDTSTSRGLLVQAMESMGVLQIRTASNGQSALETLAKHPVHLVLSDFFMPDMDGIALLRAIRSDERLRAMGFILVTGRASPEVIVAGRKLGMNNILNKPFTPQDLRGAIEAVVGRL